MAFQGGKASSRHPLCSMGGLHTNVIDVARSRAKLSHHSKGMSHETALLLYFIGLLPLAPHRHGVFGQRHFKEPKDLTIDGQVKVGVHKLKLNSNSFLSN